MPLLLALVHNIILCDANIFFPSSLSQDCTSGGIERDQVS